MKRKSFYFERPVFRTFFWYCCGLVLGFLFWRFCILNIGLKHEHSTILGLAAAIFLALGCSLSVQFRCTSALIVLGFFGKAGRIVLKTIIFALIISGPINNFGNNVKEVARVFACTTTLTYNLTKTRFDLMTTPFRGALLSMTENITRFEDNIKSIEAVVAPILEEIEGADNDEKLKRSSNIESSKYYEEQYARKLRQRCEQQLKKGSEKCIKTFDRAYEKCYEKLPAVINTLLCWPVKISSICNIGKELGIGGSRTSFCDPKAIVDTGFGRKYVELKKTENQLLANFSDVQLEFEVAIDDDTQEALRSAENITNSVLQDFEAKKTTFDHCVYVINKIFALAFLQIISEGVQYHNSYINKIKHHNVYVTKYFEVIDNRRLMSGKLNLLPLKKIERQGMTKLKSCRKLRKENTLTFFELLRFSLEIITVSCFILLDNLFSTMLAIVAEHSQIDYSQRGYHNVKITVKGTGFVANLIKSMLLGFNSNSSVHKMFSNEACLPKPSQLNQMIIYKIYGLYAVILLLLYNGVFIMRFKSFICAKFYPKREKERILFMYNLLLRRRSKLLQHVIEMIQQKSMLRKQSNVFLNLRTHYPKCCTFLKVFELGRYECDVCDERESYLPSCCGRNQMCTIEQCSTETCDFRYCVECWREIDQKCPACGKRS